MLIEYDLVIIGATELGCRMALRARQLGARVALVEQGEQPETTIAWRHWLACDSTKLGSELSAQLDLVPVPPRVDAGNVCCKWKLSMRSEDDPEYVPVAISDKPRG